jgi:pSer/pThr/pTyr-binding forkhead associated (FHA) protein
MTDPNQAPPSPPGAPGATRSFSLKFISGKYQGGEFALPIGKEIIVGRSSDLEMVLVEDMVSRKHARIFWDNDQIEIEDLGSTNGTFVNGEKIKRATLKEGDRVLIGTSILKVIASERPVSAAPNIERSKENLETAAAATAQKTSVRTTMSGAIDEIPLPDLLQLLSSSKKTGVLVVRCDDGAGSIHLRKGQAVFAVIDERTDVSPLKTIFRLLTWTTGSFDFDAVESGTFPNEIDLSVPEILMEGLRQIDELSALRDRLPSNKSKLSVAAPLPIPLRELKPEDLDVVQLVMSYGNVGDVMDKSESFDLEVAQSIVDLVKRKILIVG